MAVFLVLGAMLPYWPVWLESQGLSGAEIGVLTAIPILGKMVFSPVFAGISDRLGARKPLMMALIVASFIAFACFALGSSLLVLVSVSIVYGILWAPIMAFGDNITILSTRKTTIRYGRLRLWGSISFIMMSFGLGYVLDQTEASMIYWAILSAIGLTFLAGLFMPDVRVPKLVHTTRPILSLLKKREFQLFVATVALIHGSHGLYYAFASLHWRALGYSDTQIGFLWAEAVVVEVLFFLFAGRIEHASKAVFYLTLAGVASILRWSIQSYDPGFEVLLLIQGLHALTFGAMHLGAVAYVTHRVPLELSATAQSLYGAGAFGIGTGITILFVGVLYECFEEKAFLVMTLMGVGGTLFSLALQRMIRQTACE